MGRGPRTPGNNCVECRRSAPWLAAVAWRAGAGAMVCTRERTRELQWRGGALDDTTRNSTEADADADTGADAVAEETKHGGHSCSSKSCISLRTYGSRAGAPRLVLASRRGGCSPDITCTSQSLWSLQTLLSLSTPRPRLHSAQSPILLHLCCCSGRVGPLPSLGPFMAASDRRPFIATLDT